MADTERIVFPDGNWWEFKIVVTRGMRKAFRAAGVRAFLAHSNGGIEEADTEAIKRAILAHPERWDLDAVDDVFLLRGTVAWSWQTPLNVEAIDALPDNYVSPVLARMRELYAEPSEETVKK